MAYKKRSAKFTPVNEEQERALETIMRIADEHGIELLTITDSDFAEAFALHEETSGIELKSKMTVGVYEDFKKFVLKGMLNTYFKYSDEFFVCFTAPVWRAKNKRK